MPDRNQAADAARLPRRSMLLAAAGAGAAGVAAAALGSTALPALAAGSGPNAGAAAGAGDGAPAGHPQVTDLSPADLAEPLVVHVRDAARGELEVFRGATATRLRDRDLAARLVRASTT
ncbi:MAG TPA: hypothetical protein VFX25_27730 [Streptosporangiaceae bacterium]|nr:hypothetical protein [Streptosporangiaceae bacterium]